MVGASIFPPVAGLISSFQRMLPSFICGFITEDVTNNAGYYVLVGLIGIEPMTSTMST